MADPKSAGPDAIMSASDFKGMKTHLDKGRVPCAIGLTVDKQAVLLMDPKKQPASMIEALKKAAAAVKLALDPSSIRYGEAEGTTASVTFWVNRSAAGTMDALLKKQTGATKVVVDVDPKLEPQQPGQGAPPPPPPSSSLPSDAVETAPQAEAPPPPPPPPPPQQAQKPAADPATTIKTSLAQSMALIQGVAAGDAPLQALLVGMAQAANEALKGGDLAAAAAKLQELRRAIADKQGKPAGPAEAGPVAYGKARLAWLAARGKMVSDIEKLRGEIVATYAADGLASQLQQAYTTRVSPLMAELDEELADKLDAATNATDPVARGKLVQEARAAIDRYTRFLASETLFNDLDDNPFVKLGIRQTIGGTLAALAKAVH